MNPTLKFIYSASAVVCIVAMLGMPCKAQIYSKWHSKKNIVDTTMVQTNKLKKEPFLNMHQNRMSYIINDTTSVILKCIAYTIFDSSKNIKYIEASKIRECIITAYSCTWSIKYNQYINKTPVCWIADQSEEPRPIFFVGLKRIYPIEIITKTIIK